MLKVARSAYLEYLQWLEDHPRPIASREVALRIIAEMESSIRNETLAVLGTMRDSLRIGLNEKGEWK